MRRLITLHIGRGLERYEQTPLDRLGARVCAALLGWLGAYLIQLPAGRIDMQRWGLHPGEAQARVTRYLENVDKNERLGRLATNDASTINALVEALSEGELRVVSHAADGTVKQWDVDQMMAFWLAREQGSEMPPAAMLIKLGVWT